MYQTWEAFLVAQLVKNLPADGGDARDVGLIPRSGRSPGEGNGKLLLTLTLTLTQTAHILAWEMPWTEEPGGLQSVGLQNQTLLSVQVHTHTHQTWDNRVSTRWKFSFHSHNTKHRDWWSSSPTDWASYLFILSLLAYSQGHYVIAEWPVRGKNKHREEEHSCKAEEPGFDFESFPQNSPWWLPLTSHCPLLSRGPGTSICSWAHCCLTEQMVFPKGPKLGNYQAKEKKVLSSTTISGIVVFWTFILAFYVSYQLEVFTIRIFTLVLRFCS